MKTRLSCIALCWLGMILPLAAQITGNNGAATAVLVPRLVRFGGVLTQTPANPGSRSFEADAGIVQLTFALYSNQNGGQPLWVEIQKVSVDSTGHYTVSLGSTKAEGLPVDLFTSGQARWLGVRQQGQFEQQRIMLLSVPYALKAGDIETFGGKPPSAYALASGSGMNAPAPEYSDHQSSDRPNQPPGISGSGTTNYLPLWTNGSTLSSSAIYQSPTGSIGIGTTEPVAQLTVAGLAATTTMQNGIGASGNGTLAGVAGSSASPTGFGVFGNASSTSGNNIGVSGSTASDGGGGVTGQETATSGIAFGVEGLSSSPTGVGGSFTNSATACTGHVPTCVGMGGLTQSESEGIAIRGAGIHGSVTVPLGNAAFGVLGTTNQDGGIGVVGTTDDAIAMRGLTNSTDAALAAGYFDNVQNRSQIAPVVLARSREFDAECVIDVSGDLTCTGTISAVVPVDVGSRNVALYAEESPENWFEDAGSATLVKGSAVINLEPVFAQTVNTGVEYHVFLTPTGECEGLYVTNKAADSFEVRELGGGAASIGFDYRIVARRKGYETIRLADRTKQFENAATEPKSKLGVIAKPRLPQSTIFATSHQ